jgi:hypothetical protein
MTINAHLDYVTAVNFNRDSTLIVSCSLDGLMYVTNVLGLLRLLNKTKTLVEHHDWDLSENLGRKRKRDMVCNYTYTSLTLPALVICLLLLKHLLVENALTSLSANTSSSRLIVNTSSRRRTIPLSGCGTTKHLAASRRMLATGTSYTAFPHAFRSRVGSG